MGIGVGLFLIAIGAILAFALNVDIAGFSLDAVGWILMLTGVTGLILTFTLWKPHQARMVTRRQRLEEEEPVEEVLPPSREERGRHREERWVYDEEPPPV
ncbi:MAG: hypothetical protein GEV03_20865 [Streptosporangiales bacterium]|nr:hypothetical protein [Streptosporangiales bacterium]